MIFVFIASLALIACDSMEEFNLNRDNPLDNKMTQMPMGKVLC